jgi:hydroxymethylpyrimidine pyrophosphatase-like HAD family hydrolase
MKPLFLTDLDHTFLRTDLSVSDYTKTIWNSFEDKAHLGIATARSFKKATQFLDGVALNTPMVLLDGALLATMDKKIIDTKTIDQNLANAIIKERVHSLIFFPLSSH